MVEALDAPPNTSTENTGQWTQRVGSRKSQNFSITTIADIRPENFVGRVVDAEYFDPEGPSPELIRILLSDALTIRHVFVEGKTHEPELGFEDPSPSGLGEGAVSKAKYFDPEMLDSQKLAEVAVAFVSCNAHSMGKKLLPRGEIFKTQDFESMRNWSWYPEMHDFGVLRWLERTPEMKKLALACTRNDDGSWNLGELGHHTHRHAYLHDSELVGPGIRGETYAKFVEMTKNQPRDNRPVEYGPVEKYTPGLFR